MTQVKYSKYSPGKYGIALDWETTGSNFNGDSSVEYQGIAFGVIVFDTETFKPVETLYRELHFDETKYLWSDGAEKIHGLSREHLATNGVPREEALVDLLELIVKYIGTGNKVLVLGHNADFDIDFTKQLGKDFGIEIPFHHVKIDTSGIGFLLTGEYKSDVVFEILGEIGARGSHNALDDAAAALASARNARNIFALGLQVKGND